jgi:hypothetical protein
MIGGANTSIFKDLGLYFNKENKVQLPLPMNFFDSNSQKVEDRKSPAPQIDFSFGANEIYENFIKNNMWKDYQLSYIDVMNFNTRDTYLCSLYKIESKSDQRAYLNLNQVTSNIMYQNTVTQNHDILTDAVSPTNVSEFVNFGKIASADINSIETSVENKCASTKVPTKGDLYRLSILIQDTNPEFDNFTSGSINNKVDECRLSGSGLFISKNISGFQWTFEIFFEKNEGTNRNRRQLRCKHGNCNKVFKKAWNLFDHMRIHTGK